MRGHVFDDNNNLIEFTNTCTIDYFFLAMWRSWRLVPFEFLEDEQQEKSIYEIIKKMIKRGMKQNRFGK